MFQVSLSLEIELKLTSRTEFDPWGCRKFGSKVDDAGQEADFVEQVVLTEWRRTSREGYFGLLF